MRGLLYRWMSQTRYEGEVLARVITGGRACIASQIALFIGIAYLVGPVDFIPAKTPYVGHLDEVTFLVGGLIAARFLLPSEQRPRQGLRDLARAWSTSLAVVPNFFIVGAARCGTTSLFDAIRQHPDVFGCPVKEPNHFASDRNARPWVIEGARRRGVLLAPGETWATILPKVAITPDYETYLSLFAGWSGQHAVGEASTLYLLSSTAAAEIARRRPDARIIVVLRQPVERAQSEYLMHAQVGRDMAEVDARIAGRRDSLPEDGTCPPDVIKASLYAPQIRRYLDAFPREQILFLLFEDMVENPAAAFGKVFAHIGVDPAAGAAAGLQHENRSRAVRAPRLNKLLFESGLRDVVLRLIPGGLRRRLAKRYYAPDTVSRPAIPIAFFHADISETASLTGLDLGRWLAQTAPVVSDIQPLAVNQGAA